MARLQWSKKDTLEQRFIKQVKKTNSCWIWTGNFNVYGYGRTHYKRRAYLAHRLSYELANGPIPEGLGVCHKCDVTACVNPAHLFLGDQKVNMQDAKSKDRTLRGERNSMSKLTVSQVREIKRLTKQNTQQSIAELFGVSRSLIGLIANGKRWSFIGGLNG